VDLDVLGTTPAVLDALLRGKSSAWLNARKAPNSFSPIDVVGHLILAEQTDWLPRILTILEHQDSKPFEPFDRFAFQPIIAGKSIENLLDEFAAIRKQSLATLATLAVEDKLDQPGRHPEFGHVTLGNLLATWVVHDLGHISQITKAMASHFKDAVGPWRAYLTILE
jgi:hypothetical protein